MRLDLLLVRLRFAKSRNVAQRWINEGHFRLGGVRVSAADTKISPGAVLTLPLHSGVQVIAIDTLPDRRGPPVEARSCYHALDAGRPIAIAGDDRDQRGAQVEGIAQP